VLISKDKWDLMLISFRDNPGKVATAARAASVARETAHRAWNRGWEKDRIPAIKGIIADEERAARAALEENTRANERARAEAELVRGYEDAEKARQDVIRNRKQEADMVRGERGNVIALIGTTGRILRGALDMAPGLERQIREGKDIDGRPLMVRERIEALWKLARVVKQSSEAACDVIRAERLLLGEPTEILGIKKDLDSLTMDDAIRELEEAGEMAARMRRRKDLKLRILNGGQAEKPTGTDYHPRGSNGGGKPVGFVTS
jgi:hypothetical protein